jgi:Flp pilus assembly protein TadD
VKLGKISGRVPNLSRMQRQAYNAFQQGELDKTERLCAGILDHRRDDFDALHLLGLLNFQRHRMAEALHFISAALGANPGSVDAMSNLGLVLHAMERYPEAVASYQCALGIVPDHPEILYNLGNACLKLGRPGDALTNFDGALTVEPGHVGALVNRGNALLKLNRPEEAIASYDSALGLLPGHPQIKTNRGHALRMLDKPGEALANFADALAAKPDFAEAHFEQAMARLTLGDFDAGWTAYEWRWSTGAFAAQRRHFQAPLWLGDQPVLGKTVLLHAEQGFGDTIQFIRYARLVAALGARVIVEVQPELLTLLSQVDGIEVIPFGQPLPAHDLQCPLLSLPLALKTQPATIPVSVPYLAASAARQACWQDRLPSARRRVGLVWSGRPSHNNDCNRSIALKRLRAVFEVDQIQWVGLQCDVRDEDREFLRGLPNFTHLGDDLSDFTDTAAIVSLLDMVISVDTAVAHLAGALGKPVTILLPYAADFRWMRGRDDSPWYPTATLVRQPAFGDWEGIVPRLCDALKALA